MEISVSLQTTEGTICRFRTSPQLRQLAMRWSYVVRNRSRWSGQSESRRNVRSDAAEALAQLGIRSQHLRALAGSGIVQVRIPFESEQVGWEARVFPWEFVLSAATKRFRGEDSLTVVRHLATQHRTSRRQPASYAILESAPGFRDDFDFEAERDLMHSGLQTLEPIELSRDPTKETLASQLKAHHPDVLHVSGIDAHLGAQLLEQSPKEIFDGIFLAHRNKTRELVYAQDFAETLATGTPAPLLVGFNCWYSGPRIAALAVSEGIGAAIGFQNTFDDKVSETFFYNFYRAWVDCEWDTLAAFLQAWEAVRPQSDKVRGTGVTLWSANSLVKKSRPKAFVTANREGIRRTRESFQIRMEKTQERVRAADPNFDQIRDLVGVSVKPLTSLNYCLLHNRRSLVEELYFWFKVPLPKIREDQEKPADVDPDQLPVGVVRDLEVEVMLKVGEDSFPYRTKLTLSHSEPQIDLADAKLPATEGNPAGGVRVPLISKLARSVDERMETSLYVNVQWHDQILYRHTHSVSLSPVDEWRIDQAESCWLPSFVQPRDPAVTRIVDSAQNYLRCIEDDPHAGFRGYQADDIDPQVKAIWSAIVYDYRLDYVSPPPSYSENTQRLRTPSQVIAQNRGTCVDLSILLVSCLEWIELFPVILMTDTHAFPGYWASEKAHRKFLGVAQKRLMEVKPDGPLQAQEIPWVCGPETYAEIKRFIDDEELIPLESVSLTERSSFIDAYTYACDYFNPENPEQYIENEFESMIDIVKARESVTPLPLTAP